MNQPRIQPETPRSERLDGEASASAEEELQLADEALPCREPPEQTTIDINEIWQANYLEQVGDQWRYSLAEFMVATAAASVLLAGLRLLPRSIGAAVLGLLVLVLMGLSSGVASAPRILHLLVWITFLLYVVTAVMAAVVG